MQLLCIVAKYLKFVGLLGIPMFWSDWPIWKVFWMFWLFGVVELVLTFPVMIQGLKQIFSMIVLPLVGSRSPDPSRYDFPCSYQLPFQGKWAVLNGSVEKSMSHSWAINSQRYAYDFVKLDDTIASHKGDPKKLENYYCYGEPVLAPADGVVVGTYTKCRDSKIMWRQWPDPIIRRIEGNFITLKHGEKEYSTVAHLRPGSLLVKVGDVVAQGDKIAECGNTGNTSEPHIHFQVHDGRDMIFSSGIPICFEGIQMEPIPNYSKIDPRQVSYPTYKGNRRCQFIHRGLFVENKI